MYSAFFQLLASILATYIVADYHKGKSMPWVVFAYVIISVLKIDFDLFFFNYNFQDCDGPYYYKVSSKSFLEMYRTLIIIYFFWKVMSFVKSLNPVGPVMKRWKLSVLKWC